MILCAGEALIDMLPRETTRQEAAFAPYPGGAVFNTAIALGRLGAKVGFFSGISTDLFGEILSLALADSHVESFAHRSARPTTLAFVTLVDGHAKYAFYDENTAGRMLTAADLPVLPNTVQAMFFGGISLPVEPCGAAYEALMAREAAKRVTMIDPNIRPSFITDESAYRARIGRMIAMADIVKLSDEDLHWLLGKGETGNLAREVLEMGAKVVLITEGAKGARAVTSRGEVAVETPKVTVADTVGAGDTFNAGFLAALGDAGALTKSAVATLDETTLRAGLSLGTRAAAVTVSRSGANPPWGSEL
jgi:fructokinase